MFRLLARAVAANTSGSLLSPDGRSPVTFRSVPELALDDEEEWSEPIEALRRDNADALEEYRDGDRLAFAMPNQFAVGYA